MRYAKAVVAAVVPVLVGVLHDNLDAASDGGVNFTNAELRNVVLVALLTAAGVFIVPNRPPKGEPARPDMSEQGNADLATVLIALACAVIVLAIFLWFR